METRQTAIRKLEEFKKLLITWEYGNPTTKTRSEINQKLHAVRQILGKTGTLKTVTIAPPPAVGGQGKRRLDVESKSTNV